MMRAQSKGGGMDLKRQLAEAVGKALDAHGGSQRDAAKEFGVGQMDVSVIRRGLACEVFSLDKLVAVAGAFGISFEVTLKMVDRKPMNGAVSAPVVLDDLKGVF